MTSTLSPESGPSTWRDTHNVSITKISESSLKRRLSKSEVSPSPRSKRVRAATPLTDTDTATATGSASITIEAKSTSVESGVDQNASGLTMPMGNTAGPSSYNISRETTLAPIAPPTSEEAKSVLFSDNNLLEGEKETELFVPVEQEVEEEDQEKEVDLEEPEEVGERFEAEEEEEPGDIMTRYLDGLGGKPRSYHSGDSEEFEMDHRPILERTAVKKDIKDFTAGLELLRGGENYSVVDRLGEGTFSSVYLANDLHHVIYQNGYWTDNGLRRKVALKKILATSSPARIYNELALLEALRGCRNVSQLVTAWREEDQVIIVLPYHRTDDFRHYFRQMDTEHIRLYMQSLLQALKDIHQRGVVHRDVKPANFLFDYESGQGVLCDFGLAERYVPPRKATCIHSPATLDHLHGKRQAHPLQSDIEQSVYEARKRGKAGEGKVGFLREDKRPSVKTNRAGTRGFRAPEVMLKCPDQTVGIILLGILTHKFPIFNSNDDIEALMEIAAIFGRTAMEKCAMLHGRTFICNVPTIDSAPKELKTLILRLNPNVYTPPVAHPTPDQAREHIEGVDLAIDLCTKLLRLDCTKRITASAALKHPFLVPGGQEQDLEDSTLLEVGQGKCGPLHGIEDGKHKAYFSKTLCDMHFGQGIAQSEDLLCPEHENWQLRTGINPLAVSSTFYKDENPVSQTFEPRLDNLSRLVADYLPR